MVHSVETTAANVADIEVGHKLIREDEHLSKVEYRVNSKKGEARKREAAVYKEPMKHLDYMGQPNWERHREYLK